VCPMPFDVLDRSVITARGGPPNTGRGVKRSISQ
jgi:hypothetical protein